MTLVSINIPTYNAEKTLATTLRAVQDQTYKDIEIIIIDSNSKDKTIEIAKSFKTKVVQVPGNLLEARIEGVKKSQGKYVLLLDADQILETTAVERAMAKIKDFDSLWFFERAYNRDEWIPSLYDADRLLVQTYWDPDADIVLPRFFRRDLLLKAYENIPKACIKKVTAQDHIITWHEFKQLSKRNGMLENAVEHIEPNSLRQIWKKQWRWGKTTREFFETGFYPELVTKKNAFRKFHKGHLMWNIKSFILRVLRGVPFKMGYKYG